VTTGVDRNAKITVAANIALSSTDPHSLAAGINWEYLRLLYDNLFTVVNGKTTGELVTAWKFENGALVLTLHSGTTFQDGTPIDASAVKANLDEARSGAASGVKGNLASIQSVDVVDPQTVRLNLAPNAGATLPDVLSQPAGMMVNPKFLADPSSLRTSAPAGAGSGPYRIASWTPGEGKVLFERAGTPYNQWDPASGQAAEIEMDVLPDPTTSINAVQAGQYDLTYVTSSIDNVVHLAQAAPSKLQVLRTGYPFVGQVFMADKVDTAVRQAMGYAVNRQALIPLVGGGAVATNQLYINGQPLHVNQIDTISTYDPAKAKALVATAPKGSTTITLGYTPGTPSDQIAQLLQTQMAAVGIDLKLQPLQTAALFQQWAQGKLNSFMSGFYADPVAASTALDTLLLPGNGIASAPASALPQLEAQLNSADNPSLSVSAQNSIYQNVLLQTAQEGWAVALYSLEPATFASKKIVNQNVQLPYGFSNLRYLGLSAG
jgi:peptide/nickel transport system substrate-binding protein